MPVSGAWRLSYSLEFQVHNNDANSCYIYFNGEALIMTRSWTNSEVGWVYSAAGRDVTLEASAGDQIEIRADGLGGHYLDIQYCAEYIPRI